VVPAEVAHLDGYQRDPHQAWGFHEHIRRIMKSATPHRGYEVLTRWIKERWPDSFLLTTNIDGLHRRAGAPEHRLWERYGNIWELQCVAACQPEVWPEPRAPLSEIDPDTMKARTIPRCPFCGGPARPRVQLDHDPDFLPKTAGGARYERFLEEKVDLYLVIGTTLWFSWPEAVSERPKVVHINPSPQTHARYPEGIGITMGAEEALLGLDFLLRRLEG
jgi:NAD-dependent SIR2 family protein deacetylase